MGAVLAAALVLLASASAASAEIEIVAAFKPQPQGAGADMTFGPGSAVWGFDGSYGCGGAPPNPVVGVTCGLFSVNLDGSQYRMRQIPASIINEPVPGNPPTASELAGFPPYFAAAFDPSSPFCNCPNTPGRPTGAGFYDLTHGADGNIWFTTVDFGRIWIGRMTPQGKLTVYRMEDLLKAAGRTDDGVNPARPSWGSFPIMPVPMEIEAGPDGRIYFVVHDAWVAAAKPPGPASRKRESWIGRFDPKDPLGTLATWGIPGLGGPIVVGPDRNMWFMTLNSYYSRNDEAVIGRIDTQTGGRTLWKLPPDTDISNDCCAAWTSNYLAFDPDGNLWYSVEFLRGIGRFSPQEASFTFFKEGFGAGSGSGGLALGDDGLLYQIDTTQGDVLQIGLDGRVLKRIKNPQPSYPGSLKKMPDGTLWFSDHLKANVQKVVGIPKRNGK